MYCVAKLLVFLLQVFGSWELRVALGAVAELLQAASAAHRGRRGAQVRPRVGAEPPAEVARRPALHGLRQPPQVRSEKGILLRSEWKWAILLNITLPIVYT